MSEKLIPAGYIVQGDWGVFQLGSYGDTPRGGILVTGDVATIFPTYSRARHAIKRTREYAEAHDLRWDILERPHKTRIVRCVRAVRSDD
jgi:hypothetical protein